jgi:hypothetical protein
MHILSSPRSVQRPDDLRYPRGPCQLNSRDSSECTHRLVRQRLDSSSRIDPPPYSNVAFLS